MKTTFRFNPLSLVFSLLFGVAWSFLGGLAYNALRGVLWGPLLVALYFLGLAGFLLLAILVSNAVGNNAKPRAENYKRAGLVIAALFLCSMLFEFLYELQPAHFNLGTPTSYIFLVDDSGSMSANDPGNQRSNAIYEVMKTCDDDFPFAVYRFTDTCEQILPITQAKDVQLKNYGFASNGTTDIMNAIQVVTADIKNGTLQGGTSPRILLLSDGESYDTGYDTIIGDCVANGISVSTVGFGTANRTMLQSIAEDTRGAFVWAADLSQLSQAMNTAATTLTTSTRDLLSRRPFTTYGILFGVLRCVFLLIIAAGFILIKVFMFSTFDRKNIALITFIVCAALGALAPEILIDVLGASAGWVRGVLCATFALLLGTSKVTTDVSYNSVAYQNGAGGFGGFPGGGYSNPGDKWTF